MERSCARCGDKFQPSQGQNGWANKKYCSAKCRRRSGAIKMEAWRKKDRADNPEKWKQKQRANALHKNYKMTVEEYETLVVMQNGLCPVCGNLLPLVEDENGKHPPVDHDHKTGKARGILHNKCNRAIGLLGDDPSICRRAAEYLESK